MAMFAGRAPLLVLARTCWPRFATRHAMHDATRVALARLALQGCGWAVDIAVLKWRLEHMDEAKDDVDSDGSENLLSDSRPLEGEVRQAVPCIRFDRFATHPCRGPRPTAVRACVCLSACLSHTNAHTLRH